MSVPTLEPVARAAPPPFLQTPPGRAIKALASLRLTVVLFSLAMVLVFFGTWAQKYYGIQTVVRDYFRAWVVLIPLQYFTLDQVSLRGSLPFPGGWLLGGVLLANVLAAHLVRFKLTWKRSGIIILHTGVIVMLVSELVTGLFAVEGRMTIKEGESANFVDESHACELAIIDTSDSKQDDVVVVPAALLKKGSVVRHDLLPFDVEVVKFMTNSALAKPASGTENPATAGDGLSAVAVEKPEVSGVDPEQSLDIPSAYVTFRKKGGGEKLGTFLVSVWLDPQPIPLDGKPYELALRFKRTYKPYTMHLISFRFDRYLGTNTPKNYSSQVRLTDPERSEDREVLIWMNHPFSYCGETFYQADFDKKTEKTTVLQVVRNPGSALPYISCSLVVLGMLVHFGIRLNGFLARRAA